MRSDNRVSAGSDGVLAAGILSLAACGSLLWFGAAACALLTGNRVPKFRIASLVALFRDWRSPSVAWGSPVGPATLYWPVTLLLVATTIALPMLLIRRLKANSSSRSAAGQGDAAAGRAEIRRAAGERALVRRAGALRPSLAKPTARHLGHRLGRARGVVCWASAEDSVVILGPPRSGKGLHLVIPLILDAPGAVITTSTRPDNLTATLTARRSRGAVAVFDPQGLASGVAKGVRWSPMRGCVNPQTALIRAKALTAGTAHGTSDSNFWQSSAEQAVRCLLHAGALAGASAEDLYRWSLSSVLASEAVGPLTDDSRAAAGWAQALEAILGADARQRDSVWAMVTIAFSALADPDVLQALSPQPGHEFDPETFLRSDGTLYLLGTSSGASSTSGLVTAFIEDVVEVARRLAAGSPAARLDPPLTLVLDEAANYRMPSLGSLMSEGGGTGISTVVVLQSLAQARAVWGEHEGAALWDSAIVKVVLGGGSNARDLDDLSRLIGTRQQRRSSESVGPDGRRSRTTSLHDTPILELGELRQLPFGTALLLLRAARPILLSLQPWTARRDADTLRAQQHELETAIRAHHAGAAD